MAYAGLFLTGYIFKWFKLYLIKYKANSLITRNNEVKYMFLSWEEFCNKFIQIYSNLKVTVIAKRKLQEFI